MIHLALINPKSPDNVGSVLRAAGCYGAEKIYYTGDRYHFAKQFKTDTKNRHVEIPTIQIDDIDTETPSTMKKVVIELVENAIPLPQFKHPKDVVYIFGPEDGSVPQSVVDQADAVVYIPTKGCMNLAATANVVLYDRLSKSQLTFTTDNNMIRQSRDTNNTTQRKID